MFSCSNMMKKFVFHCLRFVQVAKYKTIFKFGRMFFSIQTILISKYIKEILRFFSETQSIQTIQRRLYNTFLYFKCLQIYVFFNVTLLLFFQVKTLHFEMQQKSRSDLCFISICDINHLLCCGNMAQQNVQIEITRTQFKLG